MHRPWHRKVRAVAITGRKVRGVSGTPHLSATSAMGCIAMAVGGASCCRPPSGRILSQRRRVSRPGHRACRPSHCGEQRGRHESRVRAMVETGMTRAAASD